MDRLYQPKLLEERWQRTWEEEGLYNADADDPRETFVVMHPPPNISGSLTLGHALQLSLEDALCRWHRMRGFNTLFQPGYDHAGTSTWAAVGRELAKEGKSQRDLGREGFDAYVEQWLERYGGTIMTQFRRLGASLDYRRVRFTMDPTYSRAVVRWFVHLYNKGWVYRDNRIVNWCPRDATALSDLELDHQEADDVLSYVRYPFVDGSGGIVIGTVRPATILADVAVAVHPDDERYRAVIGREVVVPYVGRHVPVIGDSRVDPEFGSGALKVTPGHDPTDFEIGRDHGLPTLTILDLEGRLNPDAGDLAGLTQKEAGGRVLAWAREHGQLERQEAYRHTVVTCERCGSRIEPLVMLQWWVEMEELAKPALAAVEDGRVRFTPARFARVYLDWLNNVRPWCISRQIWWGHRIPVWYCPDGHVTVAEEAPKACAVCATTELVQEVDVLDTWFSSALYPFATLGWPIETADLARFYPGDVLATGRDIIFLWVARMVFSSLELLGEEPFHDVVIHSTILNPQGRRMSRTLGTGIDPGDAIEPYGADATRYGLLKMTSTQDARFSFDSIREGAKLANKLWNVAGLVTSTSSGVEPEARPRETVEYWILSRLETTRSEVDDDLGSFDFAHAVSRLYHLTFDDFCDWYVEAIKPRLYDMEDLDAKATALASLEQLLKLLHPVMPHVTEEIWSSLPNRETRLIVASWPQPGPVYPDAIAVLQRVQDAAEIFRRSGVRVPIEPEETRILDAVVRPEQARGNGEVEREIERLEKEIARAEAMLANKGFVQNAPTAVVDAERNKLHRYRSELDLLT